MKGFIANHINFNNLISSTSVPFFFFISRLILFPSVYLTCVLFIYIFTHLFLNLAEKSRSIQRFDSIPLVCVRAEAIIIHSVHHFNKRPVRSIIRWYSEIERDRERNSVCESTLPLFSSGELGKMGELHVVNPLLSVPIRASTWLQLESHCISMCVSAFPPQQKS